MPNGNQLDLIAGISDEPSPRVVRTGKDEMNFAEFPITLLTDRVPKGQKVIQYQDQIFDEKLGRSVTRKLTISADEAYGLPTAVDDDVILALIQLTKLANNFTAREVLFSRLDLIRMLDWPDSGASYKRLTTSLKRWLGVSLVYENAWWDRKQQSWATKGFHIIDNFELNNGRSSAQGELFPSRVSWNQAVFESFQAGYLKSIDYELYLKLQHPTAKRMYRFLSKRMYHQADWTFDLRDLAFEHVGLSRNYNGNAGKIKEKLRPAIEELEAVGFLVPMTRDERFQKHGKDWKIRVSHRTATPPLPAALEQPASVPVADELLESLVSRGVTRTAAAELVKRHPAEAIAAKLEVFDWLVEKEDKRVGKSPAGYLVKSIEDDYATPKGCVSKADRQRRQEAKQAHERQVAEQRRQEAKERADEAAIDGYWNSLTPEQQAALDATAEAEADPAAVKPQTGPLKQIGQQIRRRAYIRRLLEAQGKLPSAQTAPQ